MDQITFNAMSDKEFALLGGGELAYVREIEASAVVEQFPAARAMPPDAKLFMLHAADGTPIMLGDNRNSLMANAREHDLMPVSLH